MAALETIASAIQQIEPKKQSLKKAFDDLQAHGSLLSPSFSLSWSDIDFHFSSLQSSLSHRLRLLQSLHPSLEPVLITPPAEVVVARPELRTLCEKMDGNGLRNYIMDHSGEREAISLELSSAMRCASDPAAMVMDAIEGAYEGNSKADNSADIRRIFVLLLEGLMGIDANFRVDARDRAKRLASDWKRKVDSNGSKPLEVLGFLHLVAAYGLGSEFDMNEFVDYFFLISRYRQATFLCKKIGLGDKVPVLIQKLLDGGKQLLSIKFIYEFQLMSRFQPVHILKSYVKDSKKAAQKVCEDGKNSLKAQNEATDKEVSALRAVIKIIEEHKLESVFPRENLEKRVKELEKQKAERKRPANTAKPQTQQQQQGKKQPNRQQQQRGKKRPRIGAPSDCNSTVPPLRQPLPKPGGVLPDHSGPYYNSQASPFGFVSSTPGVVPYAGSSAALYGSAAGPASSHLHSHESQMASGFYDTQSGYGGGYGLLSKYHTAYYPY